MKFRISRKEIAQGKRAVEDRTVHELLAEGTVRWLRHRRWRRKDYDQFRQVIDQELKRRT